MPNSHCHMDIRFLFAVGYFVTVAGGLVCGFEGEVSHI